MAEFNFYILLLVTSLSSFEVIMGEEWIHDYKSWYYTVTSLPNTMSLNGTPLVSDMKTSPSLTSCSYYCSRSGSVTFYYKNDENMCFCGNFDTLLNVNNQTEDASTEIIYGSVTSTVQTSHNLSLRKFDIQPYKVNCFELYHDGYMENAIYVLQPTSGGNIFEHFCDMDNDFDVCADDCLQWWQRDFLQNGVYKICLSDGTTINVWCDLEGGGWTVIQRRQDGSVDFYRNWTEYVNGFGNISGEYWLGLEAIYLLTKQQSALLIEMEAFENASPISAYAHYDEFTLQPSSDEYRLSIGNFSGDCGDGLGYHNNIKFATWDNDTASNCAKTYKGAWWYRNCHHSNLNGEYHGEFENNVYGDGISWYPCWGHSLSMKKCWMKIKRNL